MTALEYLKNLPRKYLPKSLEHGIRCPSNGELRRWLNDKGISINGERPKANENILFPIQQLVFFPKSKRKTTIWNVLE